MHRKRCRYEKDYNEMTEEELQSMLMEIHDALAARTMDIGSNQVIIDAQGYDGYQLLLGKTEWHNGELTIWFTVINDSPYHIYLESYSSSVNGWSLGSSNMINQYDRGTTAPGERSKNSGKITLQMLEENADVTKLEQIDVIRVQLSLFVRTESDLKRTYCTFYLIGNGNGGFIVSSALCSEDYTPVSLF